MLYQLKDPRVIIYLILTLLLPFSACREEDDDPITKDNTNQASPDPNSFVDARDGNRYKTIQIGGQLWMAENLKYLPEVVSADSGSIFQPLYYVYGYTGNSVSEAKSTQNYATYGVLYNFPAATQNQTPQSESGIIQGICPEGWHLPTDAEWTELTDFLGGRYLAGGKLKEADTTHWQSPNTNATNETGFTALPAGLRPSAGIFEAIGINGFWWSATENGPDIAWFRNMYYLNGDVYRIDFSKASGFCVRCLANDANSKN